MTGHSKKHSSDEKPSSMPSTRFEDDALLGSQVLPEDAGLPTHDKETNAEIELLTKALKEAQEKADSHWERLLRKESELQNSQKRAQQDIENARKFAIERFATDLLQGIDSMDQALGFSEGKADLSHLVEGMRLTHELFISILEKQGIQVIQPVPGEPFNPNFHEALTMQETADFPANTVVTVIQKGYMLQNRLLRAARVVVAKAPSA